MLGHAGGDVGHVMLDGDNRFPQCLRDARRVIVGVKIVGDQTRLGVVQTLDILDRVTIGIARLGRVEIAEMLAEHHARIGAERHRCLEVAADGEDTGRHAARRDGRRISARSPHDHRSAGHDANDRIVHRPRDRPVVHEEQVGDTGQTVQRLGPVDADWLVGAVAAGRDHREAGLGQQEVVQRRIGQHGPDARVARRSRLSQISGALADENDRTFAGGQQGRLRLRHLCRFTDRIERPEHHCKRLLLAVLSVAQALHGGFFACIHHQVEAAKALDRDDLAFGERAWRPPAAHRRAPPALRLHIPQRQLWPADRAGVWLGVEAPVGRVLVFRLAVGAHDEMAHGRARPVVGQVFDDRIARAAVRAVGEGIAVAAVGRVADLRQAFLAGREVGQHRSAAGAGEAALANAEQRFAGACPLPAFGLSRPTRAVARCAVPQ